MDKSYYKNGVLFEKFYVHHHKYAKIRNRTEAFMIDEICNSLKEPLNVTIETLHTTLQSVLNDHIKNNPKHGGCTLSEIHPCGSIIGHTNWKNRGFELYAPGRNTATVSITDNIFKDADNCWKPVSSDLLIYNKAEILED